jgi:tripartite-type tricarboxylate transporter receptor subunit TctC
MTRLSSPEAITETMAGQVDYFFCTAGVCFADDQGGQKLPSAGCQHAKPVQRRLPDVPTVQGLVWRRRDYVFWMGMLVSSKRRATSCKS